MGLRLAVAFLFLAIAWSLGWPGTVALDERMDPDAYADAMGVPEVFDGPPRTGAPRIDPEPHRASVERIESVLYRRSPTDFGDAEAVENGLIRLADAVVDRGGLRERQAGLELLTFAGRVGGRLDSGYTLPSLVALRGDWEQVRGRIFHSAPWMRTAAADLDRIQEPPPPPMDPRAPAALAHAERDLQRMLRRGQREVERLGEPVYDPDVPGRSDRGQIRAWYTWGERWRSQLGRAMDPVRGLSPQPDLGRQPLHAEASRSLEEAYEMLRRVPDGAGMWPTPFRPAWESRFRAASDALARSRDALGRAEAETRPQAETHARIHP